MRKELRDELLAKSINSAENHPRQTTSRQTDSWPELTWPAGRDEKRKRKKDKRRRQVMSNRREFYTRLQVTGLPSFEWWSSSRLQLRGARGYERGRERKRERKERGRVIEIKPRLPRSLGCIHVVQNRERFHSGISALLLSRSFSPFLIYPMIDLC